MGEERALTSSCFCPQGATGFPGAAGRVGPPGPNVSWGQLGSLRAARIAWEDLGMLRTVGITGGKLGSFGNSSFWDSCDPCRSSGITRDRRDQPGSLTPSFEGRAAAAPHDVPKPKPPPGATSLPFQRDIPSAPRSTSSARTGSGMDQGWISNTETPPEFTLTPISLAGQPRPARAPRLRGQGRPQGRPGRRGTPRPSGRPGAAGPRWPPRREGRAWRGRPRGIWDLGFGDTSLTLRHSPPEWR